MTSLSPSSFFALLCYIACGAAFSLLARRSSQSSKNGEYPYEPVSVTFCVGLFKLIGTTIYYLLENDKLSYNKAFFNLFDNTWPIAKRFIIPSLLYFLFDTLAFFNLKLVDASTYRLLINLKVLFSGLLLHFILKSSRLSLRQWFALLLLVVACTIQQSDAFFDIKFGFFAILSISIQSFCSSSAGVYFQYLLQKDKQSLKSSSTQTNQYIQIGSTSNSNSTSIIIKQEASLWQKNFYMYCFQCLFNLIYLALLRRDILFSPYELAISKFDINVIPIIITSGLGGFMTSLILRDLNVIIKEYANFIEMCIVVIGAHFMLNAPIRISLMIAIIIVTISLYLYNINPSENETKSSTSTNSPIKISKTIQLPQRIDEQSEDDVLKELKNDSHRLENGTMTSIKSDQSKLPIVRSYSTSASEQSEAESEKSSLIGRR